MPSALSDTSPTANQGLEWGRGARTSAPLERTVPELFARWRQETPEAPAVWEEGICWTYAELGARAARAEAVVRQLGLPPGCFIGLACSRSAAYVAAALGVLQAGQAYLPLDETEPTERQAMRRRDCAAVLRLAGDGFTAERLEAGPGDWPEPPAYLLYTSGSTGRPKGVVVPHGGIVRLVCETDYAQLQPGDVVSFHSNLSFDASTFDLWAPLLNGAALVVTSTETVLNAAAFSAHLERYRINAMFLTASLFAQLAQELPAMFAKVKFLLVGGEAVNPAAARLVLREGPPRHLVNGYGPTEATTFAVCYDMEAEKIAERVPLGRPIAQTDAFVLDGDLQPAVEGELYLGGPGLALGYQGDPALTAARFLQTDWGRLYRTGDLARWRPDGLLDYLGRADRQVKIRGFRIEPGEIEAALWEVPGVTGAAVLPRRDRAGALCLAAYYLGSAAPDAVRAALRERLPAAFVPAALVPVPKLPLNANGKLDESALPPAFPETSTAPASPPIWHSPLQQMLAATWGEVLGVAVISPEENFFDLGGTSLSLLRVYRQLRLLPECASLRVVDLFGNPTLRSLAHFLEAGKAALVTHQAAQERAEKLRLSLARRRLLSKR